MIKFFFFALPLREKPDFLTSILELSAMKNHSENSFRKFRIHIAHILQSFAFCQSKFPSSIPNFGFALSFMENPDFLSSCQQCTVVQHYG